MQLELQNEQTVHPMSVEIEEKFHQAIALVFQEEGWTKMSIVTCTLIDDESIKQLNAQYRNKDKPTDVLSFPMFELQNGAGDIEEMDVDPETGYLLMGDIFISVERAFSQAEYYGHSYLRELLFLFVHGLYHLMGYDHQTPEEEAVMNQKQEAVLEKMGIPRK